MLTAGAIKKAASLLAGTCDGGYQLPALPDERVPADVDQACALPVRLAAELGNDRNRALGQGSVKSEDARCLYDAL